jgi:glycosyltransferase involved in cell wall biosynthesis
VKILYHAPEYVCLDGDAGGVYRELLTRKTMAEQQGARTELFHMWDAAQLRTAQVLHSFFPAAGSYPLCRAARTAGCRLVVSPIYDYLLPGFVARGWIALSHMVRPVLTHLGELARVLEIADAVVVRSQAERRDMRRIFGITEEKLHLVWNALPEPAQTEAAEIPPELEGIEKGVLFAGDVANPRKNVVRLIEAAAPLGVPVVICGPTRPGQVTDRVMTLAGVHRNVRVAGKLSRPILSALMARARVFALPSLCEGTGLAAMEAGSMGCNVVVTTGGGTIDYFADLATYVNPRCVRSIRTGLETALSLGRTGELGRHLRDHFSPAQMSVKLMQAYQLRVHP